MEKRNCSRNTGKASKENMDGEVLALHWMDHKNIFSQAIKGLRRKDAFTDATLACEGRFFPVHKFVLSTCSEYLSDIFEWTPCVNPVIVINNITCSELEALLDFMYNGEVNVKEDVISDVLHAANCLKIRGLAIVDEAGQKSQITTKRASPSVTARGITTTIKSTSTTTATTINGPPKKKSRNEVKRKASPSTSSSSSSSSRSSTPTFRPPPPPPRTTIRTHIPTRPPVSPRLTALARPSTPSRLPSPGRPSTPFPASQTSTLSSMSYPNTAPISTFTSLTPAPSPPPPLVSRVPIHSTTTIVTPASSPQYTSGHILRPVMNLTMPSTICSPVQNQSEAAAQPQAITIGIQNPITYHQVITSQSPQITEIPSQHIIGTQSAQIIGSPSPLIYEAQAKQIPTQSPHLIGAQSPQMISSQSPQIVGTHSPLNIAAQSPQFIAAQSPQIIAAHSQQIVGVQSPQFIETQSPQMIEAHSPQIIASNSPQVIDPQSPHVMAPQSPHVMAPQSPHVMAPQSPHIMAPQSPHVMAPQSPHVMAPQSPQVLTTQILETQPQSHMVQQQTYSADNVNGYIVNVQNQAAVIQSHVSEEGQEVMMQSSEQVLMDSSDQDEIMESSEQEHEQPEIVHMTNSIAVGAPQTEVVTPLNGAEYNLQSAEDQEIKIEPNHEDDEMLVSSYQSQDIKIEDSVESHPTETFENPNDVYKEEPDEMPADQNVVVNVTIPSHSGPPEISIEQMTPLDTLMEAVKMEEHDIIIRTDKGPVGIPEFLDSLEMNAETSQNSVQNENPYEFSEMYPQPSASSVSPGAATSQLNQLPSHPASKAKKKRLPSSNSGEICLLCERHFMKKDSYRRHIKIHKPPFECNLCRFSTSDFDHVIHHKDSHATPRQCEICEFSTLSTKEFVYHKLVHEKPQSCILCDFTCRTIGELLAHRKTHPEPYECPHCSYANTRMYVLKKHMDKHKKYECSYCDEKCTSRVSLGKHTRSVHGKGLPKN